MGGFQHEQRQTSRQNASRPAIAAGRRETRPGRGPMFAPHIEAPRDFRKSLQRLLRYFGGNKALIIASTVFIAAGTLLRTLGPALIGDAIKYDLELSLNLPDFIYRMEIVLATILGAWIADAGSGILLTCLSNNIVYRLREDSFAHVQTLSMGSFDKRGIGDFISRMTNDIEMVFNAMNNGFSSLVGGLLSMITVLVAMFILSVPLSFVVLAVVPVMAVLTGIIGKKIRGAFRKNQEWVGRLTSSIEESVSGVKVIKTFRREEAEFAKFEKVNDESQRVGVEAELISYAFMPLMNIMTSLTLGLIVGVGGYLALKPRSPAGGGQRRRRRFHRPSDRLYPVFPALLRSPAPDHAGLQHDPIRPGRCGAPVRNDGYETGGRGKTGRASSERHSRIRRIQRRRLCV